MSLDILCALAAIPARTFKTLVSVFLEYVCPETGTQAENPIFFAIRGSI